MAFNKDMLMWIIESFITHKKSEITISSTPKKKFSDVAAYIKENKIGKSLAGQTVTNTDNGYIFKYEYNFGGDRKTYYVVTIQHRGENILSLELNFKCEGAAYTAKDALKRLEKKIPDFEGAPAEEIPVVDYSSNSLKELVDIFDKKLQVFSKAPSLSTLSELENIKNAMNDKVNEKPLGERATFSKPIGNIAMYIDALKMQLGNSAFNPTQFVGTYVPQISAALAELATLV